MAKTSAVGDDADGQGSRPERNVMPNRRQFTAGTVTSAATFASGNAIAAANDRIRLGFIGVANRGGQLLDAFLPHKDCEIVAVCDVDETTLAAAVAKLGGKPKPYRDFRRLIDRDDIDAVVIATPDHWHAIQTISACVHEVNYYETNSTVINY